MDHDDGIRFHCNDSDGLPSVQEYAQIRVQILESLSDANDLTTMRHSLAESKKSLAAINVVRDRLMFRVHSLGTRCMPLVLEEGIKHLPDEILTLIFESGHYLSEDNSFALRVSRVCQRFRSVALETPLLWTRLSPTYSLCQTQNFMSRSVHMGLDVLIPWETGLPRDETENVEEKHRILASQSHRWTRLTTYCEDADNTFKRLGITSFPNLQYLEYNSDSGFPSLSMPSLTEVHGSLWDFVQVEIPCCSQLSWVNLRFLDNEYIDATAFSHAVHEMQSLRRLFLTMDACARVTTHDSPLSSFKPEFVPHSVRIDTLDITIKDETASEIAGPVYAALSFLLAETFSLSLENLSGGYSRAMDYLCDCNQKWFPYGYDVTIKITNPTYPHSDMEDFYLLDQLTQNCEIAHTIHLDVPVVNFVCPRQHLVANRRNGYYSLRNLRFQNCDQLTIEEVMCLVQQLMFNMDENHGLQLLEIFSCGGIRENALINLGHTLGRRLKWRS
ncbi:hypothetical protein BD410DRAFT_538771 [Rickenella mellea]|uniref:F-box domain-containing protein n=1 Tax=Rickenella mellea TaxID=50990 RepID=A0A4Y7PRR3_9AGAM|nr:hypothetical protein BD410DRAFT_538771 [Rickenella mellea]